MDSSTPMINSNGITADSLSMDQLKRIVAQQRQKPKDAGYPFDYTDQDSLENELEDWYSYEQEETLSTNLFLFKSESSSWDDLDISERRAFLNTHLSFLLDLDLGTRSKSCAILAYVAHGSYAEVDSKEKQVESIKQNALLLQDMSGCEIVIRSFKTCCEDMIHESTTAKDLTYLEHCINSLSTILYFTMVGSREDDRLAQDLSHGKTSFIVYLINFMSRLCEGQVEQFSNISIRSTVQLLRQSILCTLGGRQKINKCKAYQRRIRKLPEEEDKTSIITTPLDYEIFRAEIISKYPSYTPPPSSAVREDHDEPGFRPRKPVMDLPIFVEGQWTATPAPSPPPSTKGKRSLYTTDQSVPFLLPLGDALASRVPSSIEEGTHLFQTRQRTTVPLIQLWEEQERFVESERGWTKEANHSESMAQMRSDHADQDQEERRRLAEVEHIYRESLTDLQSCISGLTSVSWNTASLNLPAVGLQVDREIDTKIEESVANTRGWLFNEKTNENDTKGSPNPGKSTRECEELRDMEITFKGISGTLILLLKWFRVSHILKFEYLSQVLLDSDWISTFHQAMLAMNPASSVLVNHNDSRRSFFNVCRALSEVRNEGQLEQSSDSSGESQSPESTSFSQFEPIDSRSREPTSASQQGNAAVYISWRTFYTTINLLAITQKIVKKKTHRNSLLVQAKTWLHLRRPLRIPHELLQLYCLKLYKGQVPLCPRKWRIANMRVITQIYMSCRPELREDWIAGTDLDTDLEDAKHQEAAIRALVLFYNTNRYPEQMRRLGYMSEDGSDSDEDFFEREVARFEK